MGSACDGRRWNCARGTREEDFAAFLALYWCLVEFPLQVRMGKVQKSSGSGTWHCCGESRRRPAPCRNRREDPARAEVLPCPCQTGNLSGNRLSFPAKYLMCEILKSFRSVNASSIDLRYKHKKRGCLDK
nr:uncharacterized protein LOC110362310 isoform X9 [Columba livia]